MLVLFIDYFENRKQNRLIYLNNIYPFELLWASEGLRNIHYWVVQNYHNAGAH